MSTFLDTNVVVYAFDRSDPVKQGVARVLFESDERFVVSTQVLLETWWVLTQKLRQPLSDDQASDVIHELSQLPVVLTDTSLVKRGIEAARRWQLAVWDPMIVEAAHSASCSVLLTEDLQHGRMYEGLTIENPFLGKK